MEQTLPGITLSNGPLRMRVVDNSPRYCHHLDHMRSGTHGLAALIDRKHHKNIISISGMNCVVAAPRAPNEKPAAKEVSPCAAPMALTQTAPDTVHLTQSGRDAAGLDLDIAYTLGQRYVDQTITLSSERDVAHFNTFWATELNQVACTSLFLQGVLQNARTPQWLEVASAGHCADNRVYYRPFDPRGKSAAEHLVDNPVLRQKPAADEGVIAATLKAGFIVNQPNKCPFTGFYYGVIDDYIYLMIFREPEFYFWTCVAGAAQRNPSWDYGIAGGALKANEKRAFHARLVFKPFAGVDDVLEEVRAFRGDYAQTLCGEGESANC